MTPDYRIIDSVRYPSAQEHVFFIEDLDLGGPSVTNKAELVYVMVHGQTRNLRDPHDKFRLVYKDSMRTWTEIKTGTVATGIVTTGTVTFAPWHGETP